MIRQGQSTPVSAASVYLPPLLADLAGALLLWTVTPLLVAQLAVYKGANAIWLTLIFGLFCVAVSGTKRLRAPEGAWDPLRYKKLLTGAAVLFVLLLTWAIIDTWGYTQGVANMTNAVVNEGEATTYLLVPATWIGIGLIYVLVLTQPTPQTVVPGTPRFLLLATASLLGINIMLVAFTAYWGVVVSRLAPAGGGVITLLLLFLTLAALFLPARVYYFARFGAAAYVSWLPLLFFAAWLAAY